MQYHKVFNIQFIKVNLIPGPEHPAVHHHQPEDLLPIPGVPTSVESRGGRTKEYRCHYD